MNSKSSSVNSRTVPRTQICPVNRMLVVVNSHGHFDHIGGNSQFDTVYMHQDDFVTLESYTAEMLGQWRRELAPGQDGACPPFEAGQWGNMKALDFDYYLTSDDSGEDEPEITEADLARRLSVSELYTIKLAVPASSVQIVLKTFSCTCTFGLVSPAKKAERYSCASRPYNRTISIDRYINADNGTSELRPKGIISPATIISHA